MSTKLESNKNKRLVCPILTIGEEFKSTCIKEECAFYIPEEGACAITVIAKKLLKCKGKDDRKFIIKIAQENDDLGV